MTISFFPTREDALEYRRNLTSDPGLRRLAGHMIPVKVQFTCEVRSGVCGVRRIDRKPLKCKAIGYVWRMNAKDMKLCGLRKVR